VLIFPLCDRVDFFSIFKALAFGRQPHTIAKLHDEQLE
jgi:hypothetical protein